MKREQWLKREERRKGKIATGKPPLKFSPPPPRDLLSVISELAEEFDRTGRPALELANLPPLPKNQTSTRSKQIQGKTADLVFFDEVANVEFGDLPPLPKIKPGWDRGELVTFGGGRCSGKSFMAEYLLSGQEVSPIWWDSFSDEPSVRNVAEEVSAATASLANFDYEMLRAMKREKILQEEREALEDMAINQLREELNYGEW